MKEDIIKLLNSNNKDEIGQGFIKLLMDNYIHNSYKHNKNYIIITTISQIEKYIKNFLSEDKTFYNIEFFQDKINGCNNFTLGYLINDIKILPDNLMINTPYLEPILTGISKYNELQNLNTFIPGIKYPRLDNLFFDNDELITDGNGFRCLNLYINIKCSSKKYYIEQSPLYDKYNDKIYPYIEYNIDEDTFKVKLDISDLSSDEIKLLHYDNLLETNVSVSALEEQYIINEYKKHIEHTYNVSFEDYINKQLEEEKELI